MTTLVLAAIGIAVVAGACDGGPDGVPGTSWSLTRLDGQAALPEPTAWLRFEDAGLFVGSTGCNSLGGTWEASGAELSLDDIPTTLIACPGPVGDQEAAFTAALRETASYAVEGEILTLRDSDDVTRLAFERMTRASAAL